jgi:Uncharacterized conserved protein
MEQNNKCISVGIDVCKGKWVAVALRKNDFQVSKFNTIQEICNQYKDAESIIIDIPIGLPESTKDIRPEREARKHLKGKASSIFNVPCRQTVYLKDYKDANYKNKEILEKGLTIQSYGICEKIKEVDEFLNNNPKWKNKLKEGHPEICFSKLNDGKPVLEKKLTKEGQERRLEILRKYYKKSDLVINKYLEEVSSRKKIDDVIDALVLAITGVLGLKNGFETIPEEPSMDQRGIKMQMIYGKVNE